MKILWLTFLKVVKREGIKIYTIIDSHKYVIEHTTFFEAYVNQRWDSAIEQANINKDLIPSIASYYDMMIDRIEILKTSNTDNWDAIFRSTSK